MVISAGGRGLSGRYYMLLYYLAGLLEKAEKKYAYIQKNRNILNGIVLNSQKIWVANRENLHYNKKN